MDGMKLSPRGQFTWSVILFLLVPFLFPSSVFFCFWGQFLFHFYFGPPQNQSFFWNLLPTPNLPTALLPTNPPPSLMLPNPPHPTICAHFQRSPVPFSSSPSPNKWAPASSSQEELRSFNALAEGKLLLSPLLLKINKNYIYIAMKKMMMVLLSSSSIFFLANRTREEEDNGTMIIIFSSLLLL